MEKATLAERHTRSQKDNFSMAFVALICRTKLIKLHNLQGHIYYICSHNTCNLFIFCPVQFSCVVVPHQTKN